MQIWFTLKVEIEINKFIANFINCFFIKVVIEITDGACKVFQTTGAFGATKVAGGGGFNRNIKRHSVLNRLFAPLTKIEGRQHRNRIEDFLQV